MPRRILLAVYGEDDYSASIRLAMVADLRLDDAWAATLARDVADCQRLAPQAEVIASVERVLPAGAVAIAFHAVARGDDEAVFDDPAVLVAADDPPPPGEAVAIAPGTLRAVAHAGGVRFRAVEAGSAAAIETEEVPPEMLADGGVAAALAIVAASASRADMMAVYTAAVTRHYELRKAEEPAADAGTAETPPNETWYVEEARRVHQSEGECEVDDTAVVSRGDDGGAYVMAWVWVYDPDRGEGDDGGEE